MRGAWPLTGRTEELQAIARAISDTDGAGVLVFGAAGVGKTRLVREALSAARANGSTVRWIVGTAVGREMPLGALSSWAWPGGDDSSQLIGAVIEALTEAPADTPVVIGVDDVHLLDDLSTFVLRQIVARGAAKLVLTVRDGDVIPAATLELWAAAHFDRLDVRPMSQGETSELVAGALGGTLDSLAAQRMWRLTRGNPLYLSNIVEREVADGRLAAAGGRWSWTGEPVLPPGLLELIDARLGGLSPQIGDVVDVLAVGEPLELGALTRITDAAGVEGAAARGLLSVESVDDEMQVRLAHPLYAEVRRRGSAVTRLRRLRGLVAAELGGSRRSDEMRTVVRRAVLTLESDLAPDPGLFVQAAQGTVWLADLPLSEKLSHAAIRAGGEVEANFIRAHALSWLGRGREADEVLAAIPLIDLDETNQSRRTCVRAVNMLWTLADADGAVGLIDDAETSTRPSARGGLEAFRAMYWAALGRPAGAIALAQDLDLSTVPAIVGAVACWGMVVAYGDAGRVSDAIAAADRASVAVGSFDAAYMRFVIADAHLGALVLAGRIDEARTSAAQLRREAAGLPGAAPLFGAAIAGSAALGGGHLDEADALLGPAVEGLAAAGDSNGFGYRYRLPMVIARAMQGRGDEAAVAALESDRHPGWRYLDYVYGIAQGWAAARQGAVTQAIDIVVSAAEKAHAAGQFAAAVMCLQTAVQFGCRTCVTRLRELESIVEGPRVAAAARFAAAVRSGDASELAAVSAEFELMGDLVAAADAAAHAAIVYRRRGMRGSASTHAARAQALAEHCGGAITPALRQARERLPLTDREREIVMLLAQGLPGHDVAARLALSVRTVDGHIYRAMTKTRAASRDELVALLRDDRTHDDRLD